MGKTSRYDTSSLIEDQHEPGSRGRVLKNLLGIKKTRELGKIESRELQEILHRYTPCRTDSRNELVEALAVVHTDLLLIHPFREGNGRIARQLAVFMALQAGMSSLDLTIIKGKRKEAYFAAVRAGLERDYEPMKSVFNEAILRTLRVDKA